MAVLFQYLLCMTALMCWTVQFSPPHTDTPLPGCSLYGSGGISHDTAGIFPALMSEMKSSGGLMWAWSLGFSHTGRMACSAFCHWSVSA